jgi:hypothetical protein
MSNAKSDYPKKYASISLLRRIRISMAQQSKRCSVKDCSAWVTFGGTLCRQHSPANASAGAALPGAKVVNQVSILLSSIIRPLRPLMYAVQPPSPPSSSSSAFVGGGAVAPPAAAPSFASSSSSSSSVGGGAAAPPAASSNASGDTLVNYARRVLSVDQESTSFVAISGLSKAVDMSILEAMKRAWRGCSELQGAVHEDDIEVWAELLARAWSASRHVFCRPLQTPLGCTSRAFQALTLTA